MVTDQDRIDLMETYVKGACEIIRRTLDKEAFACLEHLMRLGVICRFNPIDEESFGKVVLGPVEPRLFKRSEAAPPTILPTYEEDRGAGESWRVFYEEFLNSPALGMYNRLNDEIFIRANDENSFQKGNVLLHEVGHRLLALRQGKVSQEYTPEELYLEEGLLHAMNARLWRLWGGTAYQSILERAFYRMEKGARQRRNAKGIYGPDFRCDENWNDVFDNVFGTVSSSEAREKRMNRFVLYANLEWIERKGWTPLDSLRAQAVQGAMSPSASV